MNYQPKTDRKRGVIFKLIRATARRRRRFTVADLCPPLAVDQASNNCRNLVRLGELRFVVKGKPGFWGGVTHPVYMSTRRLRPAKLTNAHL